MILEKHFFLYKKERAYLATTPISPGANLANASSVSLPA